MTKTATGTLIMPKKAKIYIVGNNTRYNAMATYVSELHEDGAQIVDSHNAANLIIFTGGEDVTPALYNAPKHSKTFINVERDRYEVPFFHFADLWEIPMIGICRGAQLLTVLNGGSLIQNVDNHANGKHLIEFPRYNAKTLASSTHHQMMYPYRSNKGENSDLVEGIDFEIIASTPESRASKYELSDNHVITSIDKEPEIVWYPKTNSLAIQSHPETQLNDDKDKNYRKLITQTIRDTIYSKYYK